MIKINKNYSGLNKDIKINQLNKGWDMNDHLFNFNYMLQLEKIETIKSIDIKYRKMLSILNIDNPVWIDLLGSELIKDNLNLIKKSINIFNNRFNKKYEEVITKRILMTNNIINCYYNLEEYEKPVYDHVSSVTGRTKIKSGLNFLVMKKEDRNNLSSKFKNGRIYEIDIVSLEPRILSKIIRNDNHRDIYTYISENVLTGTYDRKNVKLGLISTLYGAKASTVKKLSGLDTASVKLIKEWFDIDNFHLKLKKDYEHSNKTENFYGRNIYSDASLINHFVQSSSVDCAMLAFYDFLSKFNEGLNLIATIHDSIIVDVHPDNFSKLEDTYEIYESIMDIKLPVTIVRLS